VRWAILAHRQHHEAPITEKIKSLFLEMWHHLQVRVPLLGTDRYWVAEIRSVWMGLVLMITSKLMYLMGAWWGGCDISKAVTTCKAKG
jgi:hypothetical protein